MHCFGIREDKQHRNDCNNCGKPSDHNQRMVLCFLLWNTRVYSFMFLHSICTPLFTIRTDRFPKSVWKFLEFGIAFIVHVSLIMLILFGCAVVCLHHKNNTQRKNGQSQNNINTFVACLSWQVRLIYIIKSCQCCGGPLYLTGMLSNCANKATPIGQHWQLVCFCLLSVPLWFSNKDVGSLWSP